MSDIIVSLLGKSHMAFARQIYDTGEGDPYYEVTGVVTLEDVSNHLVKLKVFTISLTSAL